MEALQAICKVSLEEELERNPALDRSTIESLQDWAKKQPHLPPILDNQMVVFLVVSGYSIEKTKKLIDVHFTMKTHFKELFSNRDPLGNQIQDIMTCLNVTPLDGLDFKGRRVNYVSLKTPDSSKYQISTAVKLIYMYEDLNNFLKGSHEKGITVITDATGFGLSHMSTVSLSFLRQSMNYFTVGANVQVNQIFVINANPVAEKLLMLLKPFAPSDVMNRIHVLTQAKLDQIFEHVPKHILPSDIGGEGPTLEQLSKQCFQTIIENRTFFIEEEKQRVNENLRPSDNQHSKLKQMSGSFKKLDLD